MSAARKQRLIAVVVIGAALAGCASSPEGDLLPPERGEWRRAGAVARYTADNLYDYIDGSAPFVISFGFQSLATADYRRADEPVTTVDLYDMGSADNAFALFRNKANLEAEPVEVGSEGAGAEARIEFWQGPYYVAVSNPSPEESEEVLALARDVAKSLPATQAWPAYLELLPTDDRVPRSEKYLPDSFLGYEALQRAVSARYKVGDAEVTLFACRYDTPQAAAQALDAFKAQLEKKNPTKPLDRGDGGFVADTFILGPLAIFHRSRYLGGLTGYAEGTADPLLADLDRCLDECQRPTGVGDDSGSAKCLFMQARWARGKPITARLAAAAKLAKTREGEPWAMLILLDEGILGDPAPPATDPAMAEPFLRSRRAVTAAVLESLPVSATDAILVAVTTNLAEDGFGSYPTRDGREMGSAITEPIRDLARQALKRATGLDLGYDQEAWLRAILSRKQGGDSR